jgi:acyl carrier protein
MAMDAKILSVLKEIRPEIETFSSSENFILEGLLDSFDMVLLVAELDKNFNISIDGEEVTLENFMNLSSISSLITKHL